MFADRHAVLRLIFFTVDHAFKEFQQSKRHATSIRVSIRYLEWDGRFNQRLWRSFRDTNRLNMADYASAKRFVKDHTIRV